MGHKRKPKAFRATTEVKRRARALLGPTPPVRRQASTKRKPPKHKKKEQETDLL